MVKEAAKQFVGYDMDCDDMRDYEIGISSFITGAGWGAEQFAKIVRANLSEIGKDVQSQFEKLYFEITGTKMYGGYND